jgi:hypothetical protein
MPTHTARTTVTRAAAHAIGVGPAELVGLRAEGPDHPLLLREDLPLGLLRRFLAGHVQQVQEQRVGGSAGLDDDAAGMSETISATTVSTRYDSAAAPR